MIGVGTRSKMLNIIPDQNAFLNAPTFEERLQKGVANNSSSEGGILPFTDDWGSINDLAVCLKSGEAKDDIFELINKDWVMTLYRYRLASGPIVQIVLRLDDPEGPRKFIRPLRVDRQIGSVCKVAALAIAAPRPLYRLELLATAPVTSEVLLVEGEKAADAGQLLFPEIPVLTWSSGAQGYSKTDLSPLVGRQVVIWPDNDPTGAASTKALAPLLLKIGAQSVRIVQVPETFPLKWDLANPLPVYHE